MKKIKTYNGFINEASVRDAMTPKPEDEVRKSLELLDDRQKLHVIFRNKMTDFFPPEEIRGYVNGIKNDEDKIHTIMSYNMTNLYSDKEIKDLIDKLEPKDRMKMMFREEVKHLYSKQEIKETLDNCEDDKKLGLIHKYDAVDMYPKDEMKRLIDKFKKDDIVQVFKNVIGKTLKDIKVTRYTPDKNESDEIHFIFTDGIEYKMYHDHDCSEHVEIEDITGDLDDLIGSPLTIAEEVTSRDSVASESGSWTFYKFATTKGYVDIRWYGSSNGYYSEVAQFRQFKDEKGEYAYN
jgi:hypothetical protein